VRVSDETLAKVIEASGQDVRQCVNALQMLAGSEAKRFAKKDISFVRIFFCFYFLNSIKF
jgi:hypothetical protein